MAADTRLDSAASRGLLQIEDCLDADGNVALPPDVTLMSLIERNIANVGDSVAYRYLDHTRSESGSVTELTWTQLGNRIRAIGAGVQQVASARRPRGDTRPAGPRLRRRVLRRHQGRHHRGPAIRSRVARSCAASRGGTARLTSDRRAHHVGDLGGGRGRPYRGRARTTTTCHRRRRGPGCGRTRAHCCSHRGRGRLPSAVHVGIHPGSGGRRDHPQSGRHQPDADDPVHRPSRPKHPWLQLVTALPRHGPVDDRLPHRLRRSLDADVSGCVHPAARTLDTCAGSRIA